MILKLRLLAIVTLINFHLGIAQEGLPIYADYLTDNYYLIHPSMAGVANCGKIRLTGRQQWFGHENAPRLFTLSVNSRIGESSSAIGAVMYNDKNGYHSQSGGYLTYAHHILFSRSEADLNMLSFGLNAGFIQYRLDETAFPTGGYDPILSGNNETSTNFNVDLGLSYQFLNFYSHLTVKNVLGNSGVNNDIKVTSNLRRYIFTTGYVFKGFNSTWSYEPSAMIQRREATKETSLDINAKVYKEVDFGRMWLGISFRRNFDAAEYANGAKIEDQKLTQISPLVGVNLNQFMAAYTFTYQANSVVFANGGFHQITLGYNFGCRAQRYTCDCPAVN